MSANYKRSGANTGTRVVVDPVALIRKAYKEATAPDSPANKVAPVKKFTKKEIAEMNKNLTKKEI